MNEIPILPGDKVELRFVCKVDEVKLTAEGDYFLKVQCQEGPQPGGLISIDMNKAGPYVRKLKYDAFLGDFT